jgi:hypothetical protein
VSQHTAPATIGPKEAVLIAHRYLIDLYGLESLKELLLEELELSEDEMTWEVTFGFDTGRKVEVVEPLIHSLGENIEVPVKRITKLERAFKQIIVHAQDGHVIALKDRRL